MLKSLIGPLLFFLLCSNLSAQILRTDSVQRAKLREILLYNSKYTPKVNLSDIDVNDYNELLTKGIASYESENFKDAYDLFKLADEFIEKHIANRNLRQTEKWYSSTPLFMMALCELKLEHEASAFKLLHEVIGKDPLNIDALDELGLLYATRLNYDSAIIQFKQAIKVNARFEKAYYHLAYTYYLKTYYLSAEITLTNLISINPRKDQYHLLYASISEEFKRIKIAEKEYDAAISANASGGANYYHRGAFWLRQKQYPRAVTDFRIACQKDSTDIESLSGLTTALMNNSEFDEGADCLYRFIKRMDTSSSSFQLDLPMVETFDILNALRKKPDNAPERKNAIRLLGLIFNGANENIDKIREAVSEFPESELNVRLYFLALFVSGNHKEFKYEVFKLYSINDSLPNTYMM
jgi:tetratricopeptide (TPR) repeat protein